MLEAMKSPMVSQRLAGGRRGRRPTARDSPKGLRRDAAYWGPELKKLGIKGE